MQRSFLGRNGNSGVMGGVVGRKRMHCLLLFVYHVMVCSQYRIIIFNGRGELAPPVHIHMHVHMQAPTHTHMRSSVTHILYILWYCGISCILDGMQ